MLGQKVFIVLIIIFGLSYHFLETLLFTLHVILKKNLCNKTYPHERVLLRQVMVDLVPGLVVLCRAHTHTRLVYWFTHTRTSYTHTLDTCKILPWKILRIHLSIGKFDIRKLEKNLFNWIAIEKILFKSGKFIFGCFRRFVLQLEKIMYKILFFF